MYALSVLIVIDPITDFANKSNPSVGSLYTYSANESLIINPIQKVNQNSDITIPDTSLRFFFQFEYFDIEKQNFRIITKTELQNLFGSKNSLFYPSVLYIQKYKPNSEISFSNTNILEQDRFTFCDETQKTKSIVFGDYNIGLEYNEKNKTQEEINNIMLNSLCLPDSFNSLNKELEIANLEDSEKMLSFIFNTEMVNKLTNTGKFSNVHITINYQKLAVNFDSLYFNNYYRKIWTKKTFLIEPNKIKLSYSFIQRSNLERDTSIFLTSIKKSQAIYTIESFDEYLNLPISNDKSTMQSSVNLGIILKMNTYVLNTSIKYVSVDDIIGLWGGTIDVLKTIAEIVLGVIINPFFVTSLINSVYSFHDSSAKESEILDFNKDINNLGELKDIMKRSPIKPRKTSIPSIILNNIDSINQIDNNSSKNITNIINFNSGKDNISKQVNLSLIQNNEKNELQTKVKSLEMLTSKEGPNSPNIQYVNIIGSNKKLNDINVDEHSLNEEDSSKTIVNRLNDLYKKIITVLVNSTDIFKIDYCCCFVRNESQAWILKSDLIKRVRDYNEKAFEISKIIKNRRSLDMIKDFLLEKEQQKFFILPSISLKTNECTEENEDENGNNDEGLIDKSVKIDLINSMSNLDLNNETNKKLVKNIAKSVI